jgi:hypothetical protein
MAYLHLNCISKGHVACIGEMRNACRMFVKLERRGKSWKTMRRWEETIKIDLK